MRQCSIDSCVRKHYGVGLCELHYRRKQRHGSTDKILPRRGTASPTYKHGLHGTRVYKIWQGMIQRCTASYSISYPRYGAVGIGVCDEWFDFRNFYRDMGETYRDDLTLDRVNNNLGYSKNNCRWATRTEQQRNMRNNRYVVYNDKKMMLIELAEIIDRPYRIVYQQLYRNGLSVNEVVARAEKRKLFLKDKESK